MRSISHLTSNSILILRTNVCLCIYLFKKKICHTTKLFWTQLSVILTSPKLTIYPIFFITSTYVLWFRIWPTTLSLLHSAMTSTSYRICSVSSIPPFAPGQHAPTTIHVSSPISYFAWTVRNVTYFPPPFLRFPSPKLINQTSYSFCNSLRSSSRISPFFCTFLSCPLSFKIRLQLYAEA